MRVFDGRGFFVCGVRVRFAERFAENLVVLKGYMYVCKIKGVATMRIHTRNGYMDVPAKTQR